MDHIKILKRAWYILWSYRALWVFGLVLALAGAGSHRNNFNNNTQYQTNSPGSQQSLPNMRLGFQEFTHQLGVLFNQGLTRAGIPQEELSTIIWIAVIFVLFNLVLGIVIAIARYVSETAVIRMVDEYESTGSKMTIRQGFRTGWSRTSWRLFLINLLVNLPLLLAVVLMLAVGIKIFLTITQGSLQADLFSIVGLIVIVFLVFLVVAIVTIFLYFLRNFFWRVCVFENVGVGESLRRGFRMARENWKNVGIMWLLMVGLGIVWSIFSIIAFLLAIPVVVVSGVIGAIVAAIPALFLGGITSLFLPGWLPWIVGLIFALPLFFTIAFLPWLLLVSWQTVFTSSVWTLVYRELKALPALTGNETSIQASPS